MASGGFALSLTPRHVDRRVDYAGAVRTLDADEAAALLGVKPATLYTYVSRGLLRSLPGRDRRSRRYLAEEVEALRRRAEAGRGHGAVAAGAMGWGQPVVETAISGLGEGGLHYRGLPLDEAVELGFAATCRLLWGGDGEARDPCGPLPGPAWSGPAEAGPPALRLGAWLAQVALALGELDEAEERGWSGQLVRAAAAALAPSEEAAGRALRQDTVAAALLVGWGRDPCGEPVLLEAVDRALVVCAEHELNASAFAVRVAASTGAGLASCLCAGLAALGGPRHGGQAALVEELLDALGAAPGLPARLFAWAEAHGPPPGLGHRLYPEGDPRAGLLRQLARRFPGPALEAGETLWQSLPLQGFEAPNLDLGLVLLRRAAGLPRGAAAAIFAVGRMSGWMAHAWEERARGELIRPRARWVPGR